MWWRTWPSPLYHLLLRHILAVALTFVEHINGDEIRIVLYKFIGDAGCLQGWFQCITIRKHRLDVECFGVAILQISYHVLGDRITFFEIWEVDAVHELEIHLINIWLAVRYDMLALRVADVHLGWVQAILFPLYPLPLWIRIFSVQWVLLVLWVRIKDVGIRLWDDHVAQTLVGDDVAAVLHIINRPCHRITPVSNWRTITRSLEWFSFIALSRCDRLRWLLHAHAAQIAIKWHISIRHDVVGATLHLINIRYLYALPCFLVDHILFLFYFVDFFEVVLLVGTQISLHNLLVDK